MSHFNNYKFGTRYWTISKPHYFIKTESPRHRHGAICSMDNTDRRPYLHFRASTHGELDNTECAVFVVVDLELLDDAVP